VHHSSSPKSPSQGGLLSLLPMRLFRRMPLRIVLTVPFVLQTFGLASVVGYLSHVNGQKSIDALVQNLQLEVQSRIRDRLNSYFAVPPQLNQINARAYTLGHLNLQESDLAAQTFWQQLQVFPVSFINFASLKGEYVGVGDFGTGEILMEVIPANTRGKSYQYRVDATGKRGQLQSTQAYDPFKEGWLIDALRAKKPIWSRIYNWDGYPEIMSISANYPVYDRQSKLIGILGVDLKLSAISDFLSQLKIGQSGKAFVIERSGQLVASSEQEPPFVRVNGQVQRLLALNSRDPDIRATTLALRSRLGNLAAIRGNHRLVIDIAGEKKYVQVSAWQDKLGLDWLVVIVLPEADFMGQIYANNQRTALLSIAAVLIATLLGILTARWIARPILRLSQASQVLAQAAQQRLMGEQFQQSMVMSSIQELETLSQSFYQMGAQLQESFAQLEAANQVLEQRVAERTQDLEQANTKITQLNHQLQTDNVRMRAELDVTRRLQQLMLPKPSELQDLGDIEISGFMEAAQEVGGDYYDIIPGEGRVTLGIGDVTGHGLESGVLMIMAQTAVRTLLASQPPGYVLPAKFLGVLNQVLYENAQRLSPGKHMTFTLVEYQNQHLSISGQHEDVLVFRADGRVEQIDTLELGMPLGMLPDIQDFIGQTQIQLAPGDGVVLYTDGIPEAEGVHRSLYGLERLIQVIQHHWNQPAQVIQERVIADVRAHMGDCPVYDDITLVILKKLG
jgi:phosphoserine phosphatase RsbU/P